MGSRGMTLPKNFEIWKLWDGFLKARFLSLVGFWIPWTELWILKPRILDSTSQNFQDSGFPNYYYYWNIISLTLTIPLPLLKKGLILDNMSKITIWLPKIKAANNFWLTDKCKYCGIRSERCLSPSSGNMRAIIQTTAIIITHKLGACWPPNPVYWIKIKSYF